MTLVLNLTCSLFLYVSKLQVTFRVLKHHKHAHVWRQNANQRSPFAYKVAWVLLVANTCILSILFYMLLASLKYALQEESKGLIFQVSPLQIIYSTMHFFPMTLLPQSYYRAARLQFLPWTNLQRKACASPECSSQSHFIRKQFSFSMSGFYRWIT